MNNHCCIDKCQPEQCCCSCADCRVATALTATESALAEERALNVALKVERDDERQKREEAERRLAKETLCREFSDMAADIAEKERDSERTRAEAAEAKVAELLEGRKKVTAFDLQKRGGEWLGAARSWLQRHTRNGEDVTWGSGDIVEKRFSVREIEDLAADVAAAAMRPQPNEERVTSFLKARWAAEARAIRAEEALREAERQRDIARSTCSACGGSCSDR